MGTRVFSSAVRAYIVVIFCTSTFLLLVREMSPQFEAAEDVEAVGVYRQGAVIVDTDSGTTLCSPEQRLKHLTTTCHRRGLGQAWTNLSEVPVDQFPKLLVDDKHQILYCDLAKVASTAMLTYFATSVGANVKNVAHDDGSLAKLGLRRLSTYNHTEQRYRMEHYLKYMVARHPWDRLVSAWRNKFVLAKSAYYTDRLAPQIITKTRGSYQQGDIVRFEELVQYISSGHKDDHWLSYMSCKPCQVSYDHISKTETLQLDSDHITKRLQMNKYVSPLHVFFPGGLNKTVKVLNEFQNVSLGNYGLLTKLYGDDMSLFGYKFDTISMQASCESQPADDQRCC